MPLESARPRGPLVGRATESAALRRVLSPGALVTLAGGPGVGKSRLARSVAAEVASAGPVHVCDLADCADADALAAAVLRAAALVGGGGRAVEAAGRALAALGPALWVLDGFDALGAAGAEALSAWRAAAPTVTFLVTARAPLGLSDERVLRLDPLPESDALSLLLDRRALHAGDRPPAPAEQADLAALARALEGVPLALELAAARLRATAAADLLAELGAGAAALAGGPGDAAPQHRSMDAAVGASWARLTPDLRDALAALAVFRGGFTRGAAAAVLGGAPAEAHLRVDALVDHSLLRVAWAPTPRLHMLEVVRAYVLRAGDPGVLAAARGAHAAHFGTLHETAGAQAMDAAGLRALADEAENLTAALAWAAAQDSPEGARGAAALALGLDPLLTIRGPAELLERALTTAWAAHERHGAPRALAARLADAIGRHAINRGEVPRALDWLDRAVALARGQGDDGFVGRALDHRACAEMFRRPGDAPPLLTEALELLRRAGDRAGEGRALSNLGICRHAEGRVDAARALLEEALVLLRGAGDALGAANTWAVLGALYHAAPTQDLARACYDAALTTYREVGNLRRVAAVTGNRALVEQEAGHPDAAAALYTEALETARRVDARLIGGVFAGYLGTLEQSRGRRLEARLRYREGIRAADEAGDPRFGAYFRACLATCEAADGRFEPAGALLTAAAERGEGLGDAMLRCALAVCELVSEAGAGDEARSDALRALPGRVAPGRESYDVRIAAGLVAAVLGAGEAVAPTRAVSRGATPTLRIARDGCGFRAPDGTLGDVGRRVAARRLLQRLATERERCPGRALSPDVLFEAGWPGDRSRRTAARNRVHVTLAALRQLGLREVLLRQGPGYLLDPAVPIEVVEALGAPDN